MINNLKINQKKLALMERKKIILIDIDGTLADFNGGILKEWRKRYPQYPFIESSDINIYNIRTEYAKLDPLFEK